MRLKEHPEETHLREFDDVELRKDRTIRVYGMPWDFNDRWEEILPDDSTRPDEEQGTLRAAALLWEVTDHTEVEWEATPPAEGANRKQKIAFFEELLKELQGFITIRQLTRLVKRSAELSTVTDEALEEAKADFLTDTPDPAAEETE